MTKIKYHLKSAKILVGSIEMDLIKYSGLKEPLKFTIKIKTVKN